MRSKELLLYVKEMLSQAKQAFDKNPLLTKKIGKRNVKGDRPIEMDLKLDQLLVEYVRKHELPVVIFSEEVGTVNLHDKPKYLLAFDPLDGSINYRLGDCLLPFGVLIAIYQGIKPHLRDVIVSGALEYTNNRMWFFDGIRTVGRDGKQVKLLSDWKIHKSTPVYLDLYYKEGYKKYLALAGQVFIRNTGSTIGNLSYVLSNTAAALGGICMRAEEIGAVYSLIKGAGGSVLDHDGDDFGKQKFSPEKTYPILAGDPNVVRFMVNNLAK